MGHPGKLSHANMAWRTAEREKNGKTLAALDRHQALTLQVDLRIELGVKNSNHVLAPLSRYLFD